MTKDSPRPKGLFGSLELPLSKKYLYPGGRNRLLIIAGVVAIVAGAVLLLNLLAQHGGLIAKGPLSAAHANLEDNCLSCHTPGGAVSDQKCSLCHEKFATGIGLHTFDAHYVYVSGDRTRAHARGNEMPCVACHMEHNGRAASLTSVTDDRCRACHDFSFSTHPEFAFAAKSIPHSDALAFTHIRHVQRVMERQQLDNVELACMSCHNPTPDGKLFQPINFDRQCASCHLGPKVQTEALPEKNPGTPLVAVRGEQAVLSLGVESLETVRRRQGPGEAWALSTSAARFDVAAGTVTEYGVKHEDPWIMHNLKLLRRAIVSPDGLSDLLRASGDVPSGEDRRELYEEALATLRSYAQGLRGSSDPVVQDELADIDGQLGELERRVAAPDATLVDSRFRSDVPASALTADQLEAIDQFASLVAKPCLQCHQLKRATIVRVQKDQRVLRRARFDHRAHVLQRDCLSCHHDIPVLEHLNVEGTIDPSIDNASIQNLPRIAECQACHQPRLAHDACTTCHNFHPMSR